MGNSKKIINNFLWRFMERIGAQGIAFIISVVLARILDPKVYGTVALVTAIITILNVLVDSGLGTALIQKKDADNLDFSTVFWFNIVMCLLLYVGMFYFSSVIASFYNIPELKDIVRVLCIGIVIAGIKNVQQAYVSRHLIFKKFFFATIGGTIASGVIGVVFALKGYGAWALVAQNLTNQFIDTAILWITVKWRPEFAFSIARFKILFSYGWKLLLASVIDRTYEELRQLVIGKKYRPDSLAFYNRGHKLPALVVSNIDSSMDSVLLPTLSKAQDNVEEIKRMAKKAIKTSTFFILPSMAVMAVCAPILVKLILSEKWLPCTPYLRIFCLSYVLYPINTTNLNAIKAMGRTDISLRLEIVKKGIGVLTIISTMNYGTIVMAYGVLGVAICELLLNAYPNKKLLNYSFLEQIKDIGLEITVTCIMAILVAAVGFCRFPVLATFILQLIIGVISYLGLSLLFKVEALNYISMEIRKYIKGRGINSENTDN